MERSRTITLFSEVPSPRRGPSGFLVSVLVHLAAICLGFIYMKEAVHVTDLISKQRYVVRLINVEPPRVRMTRSGGSGGGSPDMAAPSMHSADPGGQPSAPLIRNAVRPVHAPQTLVQPDLPPDLLAKQIPLPQVLIWTAGQIPVTKITPPRLQITNTPILHTSLEAPNEQLKIAELKISANAFGASALTLPPSTTAPVAVKRPNLPSQMPATASTLVGVATPARVLSLSDVQLERGTIALPALNELGAADGVNDPTAEKALAGSSSNGVGKQSGSATGRDQGGRGSDNAAGGGNGQLASAGAGGQGGAKEGNGRGDGANDGSARGSGDNTGDAGTADTASVTEIRQPIDGQFGAVVVGSSIAERYPETMQMWAGRMAYSVYLHVGLEKNWILQYAVTRDTASVSGNPTQPKAPWPYLMERPHLAPGDFTSDAVMVHGRLNASGHFEELAVVFPSDFSQAQFVLASLRQWRFRPATQNGAVVALEVLLIIPEED
jgi:hypothetical protein